MNNIKETINFKERIDFIDEFKKNIPSIRVDYVTLNKGNAFGKTKKKTLKDYIPVDHFLENIKTIYLLGETYDETWAKSVKMFDTKNMEYTMYLESYLDVTLSYLDTCINQTNYKDAVKVLYYKNTFQKIRKELIG